jgi:hypothetical protein
MDKRRRSDKVPRCVEPSCSSTLGHEPGFKLRWSISMTRTSWSPRAVPYGADKTIYLVVDRLRSGTVFLESEIERADLDIVINDLISGQFNDPVRIVAFNTLEHWSDDVSTNIAREVQISCDIAGEPIPDHLKDFVATHGEPLRQLTLRLA